MSVPKGDRKTSSMQFLEHAKDIQAHTIKTCVSQIPKRYTYLLTIHLTDAAASGHEMLKKANSIYPQNRAEAELRRKYFIQGYCDFQNLISQINVAIAIGIKFTDTAMIKWFSLIDEELKLIKAVMKADKKRYKDLM